MTLRGTMAKNVARAPDGSLIATTRIGMHETVRIADYEDDPNIKRSPGAVNISDVPEQLARILDRPGVRTRTRRMVSAALLGKARQEMVMARGDEICRANHIPPETMCECGHIAEEHSTCVLHLAPVGGICHVGFYPYEQRGADDRKRAPCYACKPGGGFRVRVFEADPLDECAFVYVVRRGGPRMVCGIVRSAHKDAVREAIPHSTPEHDFTEPVCVRD